MYRKNWRSLAFWRWWWRNSVPPGVKLPLALLFVALLLVGGYFAAGRLTAATAADGSGSYVLETTIQKVVTVREHGKIVVKRVPVVVRRVVVRSQTAFQTVVNTQVVTTPGGARYVLRKVVRYVPVVRKRVVTVNGKTTTVTETRLVPTVKTQTLTNVVTNQQTVTDQSTVVVNHTATVVQPVTSSETTTVTLPAETVTETQIVTQTETETETVTVVTTVTDPGTP